MSLKPLATSQFVVTIEGVTARFTTATGLEDTRQESTYNDGETGMVRKHLGFRQLNNVTLGKPYDPAQDEALVQFYRDVYTSGQRVTVAIQPVDTSHQGAPVEGSKTLMLTDSQLSRLKLPEVDRAGSGVAMIELEIVPGDWTTQ